jgi:cytosine/adenosine deaminase-related metal-dependent hydrolase
MSERATRAWNTSYRAALVYPVSSPPIRDGAVLVEGDRITWVGPRAAQPHAPNARIVELGDAVLSPGLVNAHTHLDLTVLRGLLDGASFFDWIRAVVAIRSRLTADEWLDSARLGALESLEAGVTTVADTAPTAASFDAMREFGLRGTAFIEVFGPDAAAAGGSMAGLATLIDQLRAGESALVRLGVSPHAPYSVSDELYRRVAVYAREASLPLAMHVAESVAESALVWRGAGPFAEMLRARGIAVEPRASSPVALLDQHGLLGERSLLIHCVQCDADALGRIRKSGAAVATCPMSNRYFGHGAAPVVDFLREKIRLGVGTDSLGSNSSLAPLRDARAALGYRENETPEAVWRIATLGGASALGLDSATGSLEAGKQADLAAFPIASGTGDARPASAKALLTVVAGVERVREGRLLADSEAIRARVDASAGRIREWRDGATLA